MAKFNGKTRTTLTIIAIFTFAITIAGIVWAASAQNSKMEANCETLYKVEKKAVLIDNKATANKEDIAVLKTDIKYIRSGIDDIKAELKK